MPYKNISSSNQVCAVPGVLNKVIVNSHSTGTFKLCDGTYTQKDIGGTYTPATGSSVIEYEVPFDNGLYVALGGTINVTVCYNNHSLK